MTAPKFRYCKMRESMVPVFKRVDVPASSPGGVGYCYYETHDGRFRVTSLYMRGGNTWQAQAMDGSTPFRGFRGKRDSKYYNDEKLDYCRDEIALVYELEADKEA